MGARAQPHTQINRFKHKVFEVKIVNCLTNYSWDCTAVTSSEVDFKQKKNSVLHEMGTTVSVEMLICLAKMI